MGCLDVAEQRTISHLGGLGIGIGKGADTFILEYLAIVLDIRGTQDFDSGSGTLCESGGYEYGGNSRKQACAKWGHPAVSFVSGSG